MSTTDYDYTRAPVRQNVNADGTSYTGEPEVDPNDFVIGDNEVPADRDADKIDRENARRSIPPGRRLLEVIGFKGAPVLDNIKVMVGERWTSFNAHRVKVRFAWTDDPAATIEDNFLLPPDDPKELQAYYYGLPPDSTPGSQPGFQASKFLHFIDRLGYHFPPGGKLPAEARRLGNWRGKQIVAEIQGPRPWTGRDGVPRDGVPQIKLFSYEPVAAWATAAPAIRGPSPATQSGGRGGLPPAKPLGPPKTIPGLNEV